MYFSNLEGMALIHDVIGLLFQLAVPKSRWIPCMAYLAAFGGLSSNHYFSGAGKLLVFGGVTNPKNPDPS